MRDTRANTYSCHLRSIELLQKIFPVFGLQEDIPKVLQEEGLEILETDGGVAIHVHVSERH